MFAATNSFSLTCTMQVQHNLIKCNWRTIDWLISINSNTPAGRTIWRVALWETEEPFKNIKPLLNQRKNFLVYIAFLNFFFDILDSVSHAYTLLCYCRGGSKNEKCPVALADLVLSYNAAQEGLYCPVKNNRNEFDLFALCPGTKNGCVKFCKAHEQSLWW